LIEMMRGGCSAAWHAVIVAGSVTMMMMKMMSANGSACVSECAQVDFEWGEEEEEEEEEQEEQEETDVR
jgi:hypothetical protein